MISDQDRKLAEETFDFIERSEASGSSYEANLPIGAREDSFVGPPPIGHGVLSWPDEPIERDPTGWDDWCDYVEEAYWRREAANGYGEGDLSMALAEHTASAIDKILGS